MLSGLRQLTRNPASSRVKTNFKMKINLIFKHEQS